jgi:hypothetical protein
MSRSRQVAGENRAFFALNEVDKPKKENGNPDCCLFASFSKGWMKS